MPYLHDGEEETNSKVSRPVDEYGDSDGSRTVRVSKDLTGDEPRDGPWNHALGLLAISPACFILLITSSCGTLEKRISLMFYNALYYPYDIQTCLTLVRHSFPSTF